MLRPGDPAAWYNMGNALLALRKFREAIRAYHRALQQDERDHEVWNNLGNAYSGVWRHQTAIACYLQSLGLSRDYSTAWHNLGTAYQELGYPAAALRCYDRARASRRKTGLSVNPHRSAPREEPGETPAAPRRSPAGRSRARPQPTL